MAMQVRKIPLNKKISRPIISFLRWVSKNSSKSRSEGILKNILQTLLIPIAVLILFAFGAISIFGIALLGVLALSLVVYEKLKIAFFGIFSFSKYILEGLFWLSYGIAYTGYCTIGAVFVITRILLSPLARAWKTVSVTKEEYRWIPMKEIWSDFYEEIEIVPKNKSLRILLVGIGTIFVYGLQISVYAGIIIRSVFR